MSDNGREPQAHRQQQQSPQPIAHGSYHNDEDAAAAAPEPPRFEPIFTLLTNSSTNETIHPRVRYLFADDDPSSIIAHEADHDSDASSPGAAAHRTLVVDLAPRDPSSTSTNNTTANNWSVSWAASLSPDFAITDSHLLPMQQGDHNPDTTTNPAAHNGSSSSSPNGGLMLRIDGVEREPVDVRGGPSASSSNSLPGSSGSAPATAGREDVEALVDDFRRRMGVLKKVVGEGERRREAVRAEQERHEQQHEHPPEGAAGSPGLDADAEGVEEHDHMRDSG